MGDIGSFKEFSGAARRTRNPQGRAHHAGLEILQLLVGGWDPSIPVYTRTGSDSTYAQDTTLLVTKRIADIKTDIGSLRAPSDQAEIRGVKATLDRAAQIWQKVASGEALTKRERETLAGLGELFNRVLVRRIDVTIAARDRYISELRRGERGGLPDNRSLAATIKDLQTHLSDGKIHQAALEQIGRAWPLAPEVVVQVPDEAE